MTLKTIVLVHRPLNSIGWLLARAMSRVRAWHTTPGGDRFSDGDNHRGCGGAGGFVGGRRGGRVGFGRGGAGAVLWRIQPSKFWRDPRPFTGSA